MRAVFAISRSREDGRGEFLTAGPSLRRRSSSPHIIDAGGGDGRSGIGARLTDGMRLGLAGLMLHGAASAQAQSGGATAPGGGATVSWAVAPVAAAKGARRAVIDLRGSIREGWHVYALKQSSTGPTPLVVAVEPNAVALADGPAKGSAPTVAFEPAFGFTTPYYVRGFTVSVPVRLRAPLAPGRQSIPVSVRYQSCDGRTCEPPKTVHLIAPIDVRADS